MFYNKFTYRGRSRHLHDFCISPINPNHDSHRVHRGKVQSYRITLDESCRYWRYVLKNNGVPSASGVSFLASSIAAEALPRDAVVKIWRLNGLLLLLIHRSTRSNFDTVKSSRESGDDRRDNVEECGYCARRRDRWSVSWHSDIQICRLSIFRRPLYRVSLNDCLNVIPWDMGYRLQLWYWNATRDGSVIYRDIKSLD